jgi:transposase
MKRFAGIDIGSERHVVAVVDEHRGVLVKATPFGEEAAGYQRLVELLGSPQDCLVAMEATGHYWRNLFAYLVSAGFSVALLNPIRTRRFAEEELERTKTDAVDALGIARFAAQKDPPASQLAEEGLDELREVVRLRERLLQDCGDHLRQLHRAVDLSFPEFTRYVRSLNSELATTLLARYPSAAALGKVSVKRLASLRYDGRHRVGETLAQELLDAAKTSVGRHQSEPYQLRIRYACEDIVRLRQRLYELDADIARRLERHQVGKLLTTIEGIGPQTAACIIAELGDPARFGSVKALASYVGVIPRLRQSGQAQTIGAPHAAPRQRSLAARAMDADPVRHPRQSVAARLLSAAAGGGKTAQGCAHCRHAQTAGRDLQRRTPPPAVRYVAAFSARRRSRRGRRGSRHGRRLNGEVNLTVSGTIPIVATPRSPVIRRSSANRFIEAIPTGL